MASKVFYTDLRTDPDHHLLYKLEKLVRKAGIGNNHLRAYGKGGVAMLHGGVLMVYGI